MVASGATAVFRIAAAVHQRADGVADFEARDARSELRDRAGHFEAEQVRSALRRRVEALALHHVGTVDAGSRDLDQHLSWTWLGHAARRRHKHFGPAGSLSPR